MPTEYSEMVYVRELGNFTKLEYPATKELKRGNMINKQWFAIGDDLFIKIQAVRDAIAIGVKIEAYSTRQSLDRRWGYEYSALCTMHVDGKRYRGLHMRFRRSRDGDNRDLIIQAKEYILFLLQNYNDAYTDGPYRRSPNRVQIENLLSSDL
jgi:hypothetical protein